MAAYSRSSLLTTSKAAGIATYYGQNGAYHWDSYLSSSSGARSRLQHRDGSRPARPGRAGQALSGYNVQRKVYQSASPQCPIPDANLHPTIKTGLFDYIWLQFYNNPQCDYSGGVDSVLARWNQWAAVPSGQVFLGVPAAEGMPPDVLNSQVLPVIKASHKYGGVMLWNRIFDQGYSAEILSNI